MGKNIGDDLREGKATLPLIWLRQHGSAAQRKLVQEAIEQGDVLRIEELTDALQSSGALQYARDCAQKEAQLAQNAVQTLLRKPGVNASACEHLLNLTAFAVERKQ